LSHLRYERNAKCAHEYHGTKSKETPQKRQHDQVSDSGTPDFSTGKDPVLDAHLSAGKVLGNLFSKLTSPGGVPENRVMDQDFSDHFDNLGCLFGDGSDEEQEEEELEDQVEEITPDTEVRQQFQQYCLDSGTNLTDLKPEVEAGIELMDLLIKRRAPLVLYEDIFQWHLNHIKSTTYETKQTLLSDLKKRYNMQDKGPNLVKNVLLPHSQSRIDLVIHDFCHEVQSLLSDPRFCDDDYLFHNNNPFSPPPQQFLTVSDINTGLAYRKTYEQLITDSTKQVLLPIIFYMDGTITGQYDHLPIEILKFTVGILNGKARDKVHAWRNLGYVTKFLKEETEAKDILRESGHLDGENYLSEPESVESEDETDDATTQENDDTDNNSVLSDDDHDNAPNAEPKIKSCSAQDLHAMLDIMLQSYREIEQGGFEWELNYRGQVHLIEFIPFVMFIKGDSVEHDKHCGRYLARTKGVKQLCRYCCCPNEQTDQPYQNFPQKTPAMIQALVDNNNEEGLQNLSQTFIQNCWYSIRFGLHNDYGVHGACPLEIVHWFQIGKYGYQRDMFFHQTGKDSNLSKRLNALCKSMGFLFKRQSDRDVNRTDFSKGVRRGKLMAHEMSGLILVLLAAIRTTKGRDILLNESRGKQKEYVGQIEFIKDWMMLFSTCLQWEAWLKQPELRVYDVRRFRTKVKELLGMEKKIGKREKGMGHKTFNFHAALHVADDILNFGVPSHVNTMSNEMHHKPSKTAAIHTQRRAKTFDLQTANNLHNQEVIDVAKEEINTGNKVWEYYHQSYPEDNEQEIDGDDSTIHVEVTNTGTRIEYFYDEEENRYSYRVFTKMKDKHKFKISSDLAKYLQTTINLMGENCKTINLFTEHKRNGQIFRGSPRMLGKPWRDWVMVDWGNNIILPGQIWIFVDFHDIAPNLPYEPGIYAVIESADPNDDEEEINLCDIFVPYVKETDGTDANDAVKRKFYLVDVEAFHEPTVVIPDIGNENPAAVLRMRPRYEWSDQFVTWLASEHTQEFE